MNKNKQVSHNFKQETICIIFTHPSPNPSAPQYIAWQYDVTNFDVTGNSKTYCCSTSIKCDRVSYSPLGWFTLDRNIVLYENQKFTKTDSQLPIDPDAGASLSATLRL